MIMKKENSLKLNFKNIQKINFTKIVYNLYKNKFNKIMYFEYSKNI